jgi:ATP-dependent Lhr-like helicase
MFQSRWRWNLNRSLMVLRFRGGRRNPPPIQRMESDDLLAAVFPAAAACQDNMIGPLDIPDHLLVRQTIGDTLHEALDCDAACALVAAIESGRVGVHCCDTSEASVLSHEIVTARPYAFLDDEEFQNRRTNAVQLRRGLNVDLSTIGALDLSAIESVHSEIAPAPGSADEMHDLLSSVVILRARDEWQPLYQELAGSGRAYDLRRGSEHLWVTTESAGRAEAAIEGDDSAVVQVVRGHLELAGVTDVSALAEATTLPPGRVAYGLAALREEGFAFEGRYRPGAQGPEWVARRLLARMHSYSRRARRESVEPATAQDFMRFLLRWQHVAPGTALAGDAGLGVIVEQLQGFEAAAVAWEPELLARRLHHYSPTWLDSLCHSGQAAWLRLAPRPRDDASAPVAAPSRATPISVVLRADLPWLLAAARTGGDPGAPEVGSTAEIIEVLERRGASFASDLASETRRLPEDIERGLWDGVARGLIMCDGFQAIRARVSPARSETRPRRFTAYSRRAAATAPAAGRWSVVSHLAPGRDDTDAHDLAEVVAEQLLRRWGVVLRALAVHDGLRLPWRELQWALRRLEDRGLVRGGRFVSGFSGEQYALAEAAEQLDRVRKLARTGERVAVNACDPLNLVGIVVPGATVPAVRTNRVVYVDGLPTGA